MTDAGLWSRFHWVALVLCLLNLAFFLSVDPYTISKRELLDNGDFAQGTTAWHIDGDWRSVTIAGGILQIDHASGPNTTRLYQCWPASMLPDSLMLSAEAASRGVVRGTLPWHDAHISLIGYDASGRRDYQAKSRLASLVGDRPWREYRKLFHIPAGISRVCLRLSLFAASGRFDVARLSLVEALDNPRYLFGARVLLLGWWVMALWLSLAMFGLYRTKPQGRYLLLLLPMLLIGILMPHGIQLSIEQHLVPLLSRLGWHLESTREIANRNPWALWPAYWDLSKLAHLSGFMGLSLILFSDRRLNAGKGLSALILLAVATELMQFFVPERTPRLSDVMVDSFGIGLGYLIGLLLRARLHTRTAEQNE